LSPLVGEGLAGSQQAGFYATVEHLGRLLEHLGHLVEQLHRVHRRAAGFYAGWPRGSGVL
jgi:hypothetical protein